MIHKRAFPNSVAIDRVEYNDQTEELILWYRGSGHGYIFPDVDWEEWRGLLDDVSKGRYTYYTLRGFSAR